LDEVRLSDEGVLADTVIGKKVLECYKRPILDQRLWRRGLPHGLRCEPKDSTELVAVVGTVPPSGGNPGGQIVPLPMRHFLDAEIVGKRMLMLLPPERIDEESDILARLTRGESVDNFETVRVRKDGTNIDVSVTISPIRDGEGVIVGASTVARDINDRKLKEEASRESEKLLQTMIRNHNEVGREDRQT
jgi:hypothetical protein